MLAFMALAVFNMRASKILGREKLPEAYAFQARVNVTVQASTSMRRSHSYYFKCKQKSERVRVNRQHHSFMIYLLFIRPRVPPSLLRGSADPSIIGHQMGYRQ